VRRASSGRLNHALFEPKAHSGSTLVVTKLLNENTALKARLTPPCYFFGPTPRLARTNRSTHDKNFIAIIIRFEGLCD
jgi:hypothetical protein